jgi:hypothetical protein
MATWVLDYKGHMEYTGAGAFTEWESKNLIEVENTTGVALCTGVTSGALKCTESYDRMVVSCTTTPWGGNLKPAHLHYTFPARAVCGNAAYRIKVRSLDGSRYVYLWRQTAASPDVWRVYDHSGQLTSVQIDSAFKVEKELVINSNGSVQCLVNERHYNYQIDICDIYPVNFLDYTTGVIFTPGEEIVIEIQLESSASITRYLEKFYTSVTFMGDQDRISFIANSIEELTCEGTGACVPGSYAPIQTLFPSAGGVEADFLDVYEKHADIYDYFWYTGTYMMARVPINIPWTVRSKNGFRSPFMQFYSWESNGFLCLSNEDSSKWIRLHRTATNPYYFVIELSTNPGVAYWTSTAQWTNIDYDIDGAHLHKFIILDNTITVFVKSPLDAGEFGPTIKNFFNPDEPLYCGHTHGYPSTGLQNMFMYHRAVITSWDVVPDDENSRMLCVINYISGILDDPEPETFVCYTKSKIINTQDAGDTDALFGMNPSQPSSFGKPLVPGESCIVFEKHNRIYFYTLKSGYHAHDLPHVIKMTDSLYWELTEVNVAVPKVKVEQYDIIGLVDTNEVVVTHTRHNRLKSYAPNIQFLHNGVVRTEGLTVNVKSDTELRISTSETTEIENLKLNVYVTP